MLKYRLRLCLSKAQPSLEDSKRTFTPDTIKEDPVKGIILAAGKGTRLGAATQGIGPHGAGVSKALILTYDKPTGYYPLADLIAAGTDDILVITAPDNIDQFRSTLGDGKCLGIRLSYAVQEVPRGIGEGFIIAEDFIGNDSVALTFGDNIFVGESFGEKVKLSTNPVGATIFARFVSNPSAFGVVKFNKDGVAISLEEKPAHPTSPYAVPGMYFYDSSVVEIAKKIKPSDRGELEITDINRMYLNQGLLNVVKLDSDTHWFDTGTPDSLLTAANFVKNFQDENNQLLGSPEAEAFLAGRITSSELLELATPLEKSPYGALLKELALNGSWVANGDS